MFSFNSTQQSLVKWDPTWLHRLSLFFFKRIEIIVNRVWKYVSVVEVVQDLLSENWARLRWVCNTRWSKDLRQPLENRVLQIGCKVQDCKNSYIWSKILLYYLSLDFLVFNSWLLIPEEDKYRPDNWDLSYNYCPRDTRLYNFLLESILAIRSTNPEKDCPTQDLSKKIHFLLKFISQFYLSDLWMNGNSGLRTV